MAQRSNAYNFSGDLARIGSALSRAMIGDAQDDANIARAGYYDAQKAGQEYANTLARQLGDAGAALAENPQFQGVVARAMNLDTINPQFMGPPSDSQMRTGTPAASNLARTFLGEYGNAEQMAGAASTYGDAGASRMFEAMIAGGDGDAMRRGFIGLGNNPTKYFDQGIAQTEIANDLQAKIDKNAKDLAGTKYTADQGLVAAENEDALRFGLNGVEAQNNIRNNATELELGRDLNAAKERWANYKSDKEKEAAIYGTDVQAGVDRDKNKMADTLARWEHDNREIEMSVEPGKVLVLDPETGARLGLSTVNDPTSKYNGLYILDGGKKPGAVTVTVGKGDVYIDEPTAKALGIPKVDGKYVIKGAGFETDASTRDSDSDSDSDSDDSGGEMDTLDLQRYNKDWRESLVDYDAFDGVPNNAVAGVKAIVLRNIRKDMKPPEMVNGQNKGGRGLNFLEAYAQNADVILGAGAYEVTDGSNFFVPKYFFDFFAVGNGKSAVENEIKAFFRSDLGYSADQASRVLKEIMAARS